MKTLYEILEVSEGASKEVIEKAYRVLAKKYHPDLQTEENKLKAEKHMKEINEAYSILGDEGKRKEYDKKLAEERQETREDAKTQYDQNNVNIKSDYKEQEQAYYWAQTQNQSYNSRQRPMTEEEYKEAQKRKKELLITILIIIVICLVLWLFPPTHKLIMDFYNSNPILKTVVDVIGGIFKGIWNAICSFFR